jgi:hypothetical protein
VQVDQSGERASKIRRAQVIERRALAEAQRAVEGKLTLMDRLRRWWRGEK